MTNIKRNSLFGILIALAITGCAVEAGPVGDGDDDALNAQVELGEAEKAFCTAACHTLLGGCFEDLDRDALAICRDECEAGALNSFDIQCLAELDCSDATDCTVVGGE